MPYVLVVSLDMGNTVIRENRDRLYLTLPTWNILIAKLQLGGAARLSQLDVGLTRVREENRRIKQ